MFFLLPVGHDEDSVRRRPVLSIAIVAVCIGVHLLWTMPRESRLELTQLRLQEALSFYLERPYLEPGEELGPYAQRVERMLAALGQQPDKAAPRGADLRGEQAQLDELTAEFRTTLEEGGGWPGLVPRSWSFGDLVAHMFLHAGLLHLFGNLIFLWLSAPPLEDVWGRPLFAFLYLGGGLLPGCSGSAPTPARRLRSSAPRGRSPPRWEPSRCASTAAAYGWRTCSSCRRFGSGGRSSPPPG